MLLFLSFLLSPFLFSSKNGHQQSIPLAPCTLLSPNGDYCNLTPYQHATEADCICWSLKQAQISNNTILRTRSLVTLQPKHVFKKTANLAYSYILDAEKSILFTTPLDLGLNYACLRSNISDLSSETELSMLRCGGMKTCQPKKVGQYLNPLKHNHHCRAFRRICGSLKQVQLLAFESAFVLRSLHNKKLTTDVIAMRP